MFKSSEDFIVKFSFLCYIFFGDYMKKVMFDCDVKNLGSDKTIQALGGVLERTDIDDYDGALTNVYWINTKDSIRKYKDVYQKYMY